MTEQELERFEILQTEFFKDVLTQWPRNLLDSIAPYTKAQLINGKELVEWLTNKQGDVLKEKLYIGVFMVKAGRQYAVVR